MLRSVVTLAVAIGSVVAVPTSPAPVALAGMGALVDSPGSTEPCWLSPVAAPVIDGYRPPPCRWCAGNRGLEYGSSVGESIISPLSAYVAFDGFVAGNRYLTVAVGTGARRLQVTLGGLEPSTPQRALGSLIRRGDVVGQATGPIHLGVRVGGTYVDPTRWTEGPARVPILVPLDEAPRAQPPTGATCG